MVALGKEILARPVRFAEANINVLLKAWTFGKKFSGFSFCPGSDAVPWVTVCVAQ